jgi:hypothetical protein
MTYKGYKIMANANVTKFWNLDKDGDIDGDPVQVSYQQLDEDSEIWYSVVDKDNWCIQSFETITECKDYIKEIEE